MSQHAQKLLSEVDQKILFLTEQLQKLDDFRAHIVEFCAIDPTRPDDFIKNANSGRAPQSAVPNRPAAMNAPAPEEKAETSGAPPPAKRKSRKPSATLVAALQAMPDEFGFADFCAGIPDAGTSTAASFLTRRVETGDIVKVSRSQYRKAEAGATDADYEGRKAALGLAAKTK